MHVHPGLATMARVTNFVELTIFWNSSLYIAIIYIYVIYRDTALTAPLIISGHGTVTNFQNFPTSSLLPSSGSSVARPRWFGIEINMFSIHGLCSSHQTGSGFGVWVLLMGWGHTFEPRWVLETQVALLNMSVGNIQAGSDLPVKKASKLG